MTTVNAEPVLTGKQVQARRLAIGWSRTKLGDAVGLKMTQIERIEKKAPKPEEAQRLLEFFDNLGTNGVSSEARSQTFADETPEQRQTRLERRHSDEKVITQTWAGLHHGDLVQIEGDGEERYRFSHHVFVPAQEYVVLFAETNNGERSVVPTRVQTLGGIPIHALISGFEA